MKPTQKKEFETRFPHVIKALDQIARDGHQQEAEMARQMIFGRRPGIEKKYDALLLKLDRSYHRIMDYKELQEKDLVSPLYQARLVANVKSKVLGYVSKQLEWMKARNRDLIEMRKEPHEEKDGSSELQGE